MREKSNGTPELDLPYFSSVAGQIMAAQSYGGMKMRPRGEEGDFTLDTKTSGFSLVNIYSNLLLGYLPAFHRRKLKTTHSRPSYSSSWDVI